MPFMLVVLASVLLLSGCYHDRSKRSGIVMEYTKRQLDSISFSAGRLYSLNYNFLIKADSLVLLKQQPEEMLNQMMTDSVVVRKGDFIVVADIRMIPMDEVDSVWVQVARDQQTFGWIHESRLLPAVVPDDPISQFISTFSDVHLLISLIIISVIFMVYLSRKVLRRRAKIVHFNDIDSFYPTLLALLVASAATLYSGIQMFVPEIWQHFYFYPTLNPFIQPTVLAVFLVSVWAILIVSLTAINIVHDELPFGEATLYLSGLAGVCAIDYIVFSITTLYYIGFILLPVYYVFAIRKYLRHSCCAYVCGKCGAKLHHKGRCPSCGTMNE